MAGYVGSIEKQTLSNNYFRQVLFTGKHAQLVVWGRMSITDTKPFMLPVTRHSIFGHKLPVTNSLA